MKPLLKLLSALGLALTIVPALLVFFGLIEVRTHYILMGIGMFLWFGTAPFWMQPTTLEDPDP